MLGKLFWKKKLEKKILGKKIRKTNFGLKNQKKKFWVRKLEKKNLGKKIRKKNFEKKLTKKVLTKKNL